MASGKAFIKFSHPSLTDHLIITWAEFDTPLAEVGRAAYTAPHPVRSLTITGINPVMHQFTWWTSTDGVTLDTSILTMDIDCGSVSSSREVWEYVVGRGLTGTNPDFADPEDQDTTLPNDERWAGAGKIEVERRGFGTLRSSEYTPNLTLGNFALTGGIKFELDDTWFVKVNTIVDNSSVTSPVTTSAEPYMTSVGFASTAAFSAATHGRKQVEVTTSADVAIMSFAALSSIAKTKVLITTHGMTGRYLKLALSSGDTTTHPVLGVSVDSLYLRKAMEVEIVVGGGEFRVLRYEGDGRRVGRMEWGRGIEKNMVVMDGSEYTFAAMPGLYYEHIALLPSDQVKDYTTWNQTTTVDGRTVSANKGFFALDLVNSKFKVPDLRNSFIRALKLSGTDATRLTDKAGGWQSDNIRRQNKQGTKQGFVNFTGSNTIAGTVDSTTTPGRQYSLVDFADAPGDGEDTNPSNHGFIPQITI